MVTTNRKLQTEIDRLLKKVSEGIEDFDEILKKVHGAVNPNQKEKYEAELKKEIKKLQRYRDQIKSWCTSSEIKNKAPLVDARKVIESRMELFKQCERETKTKPYSKEALARTEEMTEEDRSRGETAAWITRSIEELQQQIDACEAELETTRRRRGDSRAATLARSVERHRFHIDRLELMLRLLHNERLTPEQISDVRDGVDYYIQANAEEEFLEDDTLYESLGLFDEDEDGDGGSSSDASGDDGAADAAAPATDAAASEAEAKTTPPAAAVASPPMSPQKHPALPALPTLASAAASAVAAAAAHGHKAPAASAPSAAAATAAAAEKGKPKPAAAPAASAQPAAAKQQAKPQSQSPPQQQPVQQKPQATAAQIVARSLSGSGSSSPPVAPAPAPALVPAPAQKAAPAPPQQQPPLPPSQPKPAAPAPAPVAASAPRPVPPPAQQKPAVAQPPPSPKRLSVSRGSGSGELPPAETLPAAHAMSTSAPSQPTAAVQAPAAAPAPAPAPLAFLLEKHAFLQQLAMQPKEPAPQQQQQPAAPRQESGGLPFQTLAQMTAAQQATRMHSSSPPALATQTAPAPAPAPAQPKRAYMPYVPAGMRPLVQSPPPTAAAPVASPPPSQPPVTAAAPAATVPATTSAPSQPSSAPAHVPQQPSHPATYLPPVAQAVASAVAAVQSPPTLAPAPAPAPPTTTPPVPTAATGPASQGAAVPSVAVVPQRALPRPVAPTESHDLPSFLEASMANQSRFPGEAERARTYTPRRELTAMPSWFPTTPLSSLCTPAHMAKLDPDTLFFIFYYQQNTYQQYLAAQELKRQAWRYHKKYLTWFQRHDEPREITADHETGTYIYFDYETDWCQRMKADFTFEYRFLEE